MNQNLFLIRSPLQALNAIEAKEKLSKNEENIVLVFYKREIDKELILNTLNYSTWSKIIVKKLKPHRKLFLYFHNLLKELPSIHYCFIGDHSTLINYYMNRLEYKHLVMLEDGTATLNNIKLLENKTYHKMKRTSYSKNNFFSTLVKNLIGIDTRYLYNSSFFTIYNINTNIPIIKNDYNYLKGLIKKIPHKEVVFFIGSNLIEEIFISQELFEQQLQKVIHYYQDKNIEFIYILHRKEDLEYMTHLGERLGFKCLKFNNIIEIEFLNLGYIPSEISTFMSTAATTLKMLYPSRYTFFRLNMNEINRNFQSPIQAIEKQFIKENIVPLN